MGASRAQREELLGKTGLVLVTKGDGKIFRDRGAFIDNKQPRGSPTVFRDRFLLQKKPQGRFLLSVHKGRERKEGRVIFKCSLEQLSILLKDIMFF